MALYCVQMILAVTKQCNGDRFQNCREVRKKASLYKGRSWFDGFKSHHINLTLRSNQSLSHSHAACTNEEIIRYYFAKLGAVCERLNISAKPMQIRKKLAFQLYINLERWSHN